MECLVVVFSCAILDAVADPIWVPSTIATIHSMSLLMCTSTISKSDKVLVLEILYHSAHNLLTAQLLRTYLKQEHVLNKWLCVKAREETRLYPCGLQLVRPALYHIHQVHQYYGFVVAQAFWCNAFEWQSRWWSAVLWTFLLNCLHSDFICGFYSNSIYSNSIYSLTFFFKDILLRLFVSFECKLSELQL